MRALSTLARVIGFDPRPREGGDVIAAKDKRKSEVVSIHAPVKGATRLREISEADAFAVSIHAPVKGATVVGDARADGGICFDPRPREGGDWTAAVDQAHR